MRREGSLYELLPTRSVSREQAARLDHRARPSSGTGRIELYVTVCRLRSRPAALRVRYLQR